MRKAEIIRKTNETDISLFLELDGTGKSEIDSGCGFLNHMLTLFAKHGMFDLNVKCVGDMDVDAHHTTEDIAICLGKAFGVALGELRGINRYGSALIPMDEALIQCAVDISGRAYLSCNIDLPTQKVGDFDCELAEEFLMAFVRSAGITLHVNQLAGRNSHHIIEGCFKALARTMKEAVAVDERLGGAVPSTKGVL